MSVSVESVPVELRVVRTMVNNYCFGNNKKVSKRMNLATDRFQKETVNKQ